MSSNISLLTSAFSAYLGIPIELERDAKNAARQRGRSCFACGTTGCALSRAVPVSPTSLFSYAWHQADDSGDYAVRLFGTDQVITGIDPNRQAKDVIADLGRRFGVTSQSICFGNISATGNQTLAGSGVPLGRTFVAYGGDNKAHPTYYIDEDDLETSKDFDFRDFKGAKYCKRGGYDYERPIGWNRFALKVVDKFEDNVWLGADGMREDSSQGEWAVSYHGTDASNVRAIADGGYDDGKAKRQLYGPGIYSTPTVKVAAGYATKFTHKGKKYKMVLQNRLDMNKTKVIPASETKAGGPYYVTKNDRKIRPYGVCLQEQ